MDETQKLPDPGSRFVELVGGYNFRDIGGYETADGRRVAGGRVFRSGNLARLTDADHAVIARLGLKVILDLRSNDERRRRPSRLATDIEIELWARDHEMSSGDLIASMASPGFTAADAREKMQEIYRELPYEQAESFREFLLRIAAGDVPLLVHCAAGKDRTGLAAAVLLELLGVPREQVVDDYLLTEHFFERSLNLALTDFHSPALAHVDPAVWSPMMRAERSYLETGFAELEAKHGSVAGYAAEVLGVDAAVVEALRRVLLV